MPEQNITIKFKSQGDQKLINSLNKLNDATKRLQGESTKHSKVVGIMGTRNKRLAKSAGGLSLAFSTLRSKLLLVNFALAMGVKQLIDLTATSGKIKNMEASFIKLAGGVNKANSMMNKLNKATDGTMSTFDLFKQANNAMILGITKNENEMSEMFDMAQRLGKALGLDTASAVESLTTGIGRQSRLMLDNLGLMVDTEQAYKDYAKEIKKSVTNLTDVEKKQAFLNATLEQAREKVSLLGDETFSTTDNFKQLLKEGGDLARHFADIFSPIITGLAVAFGIAAKKASEFINAVNKELEGLEDFDPFAAIVAPIKKAAEGLSEAELDEKIRLIKERMVELQELSSANEKVSKSMLKIVEGDVDFSQAYELGNAVIDDRNTAQMQQIENQFQLDESTRIAISSFGDQQKIVEAVTQAQGHLFQATIDYDDQLTHLSLELQIFLKLLEDLKNAQSKTSEGFKISTEDMAAVASSLGQLSSALEANWSTFDSVQKKKELSGAKNERERDRIEEKYAKRAEERAKKLQKWKLAAAISNVALGVTQTWRDPTLGAIAKTIAITAQLAAGLAQIKTISGQQFEQGGLLGGRRHSQGGTMIEAEQGEFIMSRNAVESVGIENMNRINQSGGGAITVNVSGNVMTQDFVEGDLAEAIREATRRGVNFA